MTETSKGQTSPRRWRTLERWLLFVGVVLLGIYIAAHLHSAVASRVALWSFEHERGAKVEAKSPETTAGVAASGDGAVDFSLWDEKRVQAYRESLLSKFGAPLAVLRISKLKLTVPVFEGTDDLTLNRGVGRIVGTARPGELGNVGIAGHRDGFFRPLKDIAVGDSIDLELNAKTLNYAVDEIVIVDPDDVGVLKERSRPSLTLVTCYPFYFVGSAPKRYIVHASLSGEAGRRAHPASDHGH